MQHHPVLHCVGQSNGVHQTGLDRMSFSLQHHIRIAAICVGGNRDEVSDADSQPEQELMDEEQAYRNRQQVQTEVS